MKILWSLLLFPALVHAQVSKTVVLSAIGSARAADWYTTRACQNEHRCVENMLPMKVVKSDVGLAMFETGAFSLEYFGYRHMWKRHPHIALVTGIIEIGLYARTDIMNAHTHTLTSHQTGFKFTF